MLPPRNFGQPAHDITQAITRAYDYCFKYARSRSRLIKPTTDTDMELDVSLKAIIAEIQGEAAVLEDAEAKTVINTRYCWNLRDDPDGSYSTKFMNDEALQQAAVEDLLNIVDWRMQGKEVGGDIDHLTRFLEGNSKQRAIAAFDSDMVKSLTVVHENGVIELHPEHMQDAMDFAGVWLEGWDILTDEPVYKHGPGF